MSLWEEEWADELGKITVPKRPPKKRREPGWLIGRGQTVDGDVIIPYEELFETHVHAMGPTGRGKTFMLYNLIGQTILDGHGCVVIDPDGGLYTMVLNFLIQQNIDPKRVILINATRTDWTMKVSPLQMWNGTTSLAKDIAAGAMLRSAGEVSFDRMPRLKRYVRAIASSMLQLKLPQAMMPWFCALSPEGVALRESLTEDEANQFHRLTWHEFEHLTPSHKQEHLDSTVNRAAGFAEDERLCWMMAYTEGNLDWKQVLNDGSIVLCNFAQEGDDPLGLEDVRLLGSLMIQGIVQAGLRRGLDEPRHCFCFVDECGEFISDDVADGLHRLRKRKVHFVLAHQTIAQIEVKNPALYKAISSDCQVKLMFAVPDREDAERIGKNLFTGQVDAEEVKYAFSATAFRPMIEWVDIVTNVEGGSESTTRTYGTSQSDTEGGGTTRSKGRGSSTSVLLTPENGAIFWDETGRTETVSLNDLKSASRSWSRSRTESESVSYQEGSNWSQAVTKMPTTVYKEFAQPPQLTFYTLEEQWEKRFDLLMHLPARTVVAKWPGQRAVIVAVLAIRDQWVDDPKELDAFEDAVLQLCTYAVRSNEAEQTWTTVLEGSGFGSGVIDEPDEYGVDDGIGAELPPPQQE